MTMRPHVIRQGEYLTALAHRLGFDADAVWNDDKNRELRERRPSRDILQPGDILTVPVPVPGAGLALSPHTGNTYRARIPSVEVRVILRDIARHPLSGKAFEVRGAGPPHHGTTDGDGLAAFRVPIHIREVSLTLVEAGRTFAVRIGDLDPLTERTGVEKRLQHLGYLSPPGAERDPDHEATVARAIGRFQSASGLPVTGAVDDATRDALRSAHGS